MDGLSENEPLGPNFKSANVRAKRNLTSNKESPTYTKIAEKLINTKEAVIKPQHSSASWNN